MGNVVITGAGRGIGLELCKHYLSRGERVYAACRKATPELRALDVEVVEGVDVTTDEGVATLKAALGDQPVSVLINNAGLLGKEDLGEIEYGDMMRLYEVNALGPLRVTEALLGNLGDGAKVGLITSRMGSMADNTSGSRYGYRMSKAALNAAGVSLAQDLRPKGVAVAILHPGFVQTQMVGFNGDVSPDVAAARLAERIEQLNLDNSGTFWHAKGEVLPW